MLLRDPVSTFAMAGAAMLQWFAWVMVLAIPAGTVIGLACTCLMFWSDIWQHLHDRKGKHTEGD